MNQHDLRQRGNRALDAMIVQQDRLQFSSGYSFKLFDEIGCEPVVKRHLIKGVFARGETSAWIAPPGGMKSALMAEASICIASGKDWHGKRNKGAAGVVYFALERADLVSRRLWAHKERLGLQSLPIAVVDATVDLMEPASVERVISTIGEAGECFGKPPGFIIFDTFAKLIAAGGGDENLAKDQGAVLANLQRIRGTFDAHIAIIGHTGKDETRGARGSNAILGDADMMVSISGDAVKTATVTKANDGPEGPLFSFKSDIHEFGVDEDNDPITVNIVSVEEVAQGQVSTRESKLSPNEKTMYRLLHDAGAAGLSTSEWNAKARELDIGTKRKATLHDIAHSLKDKGLAREYLGRWHVQS
jgi:hypothetical protein